MGLFDTFHGQVICPYCKQEQNFSDQTKEYECGMNDFLLGDYIDKANQTYVYKTDAICLKDTNKKFNINIIIKKGQIIKFANDKELKTININSLKNIEEGLGKKQIYLDHCNKGIGFAKEQIDFNKHPFSKEEKIIALNTTWDILECHKLLFNEDLEGNDKLRNFVRCTFEDSFIYKVKSNIGQRYIKVDKYSIEVIETLKYETNDYTIFEKKY